MLDKLKKLQIQVQTHLKTLTSQENVISYKNEILGKKGSLTLLLKTVKDLSPKEKKTVGKYSNDLKKELFDVFSSTIQSIQEREIQEKLASEFCDMTIPSPQKQIHIHPYTRVIRDVQDVFLRMGFETVESEELVSDYENFKSVNIPDNHPARDMQDTFWVKGMTHVLATQTSSKQNWIYRNYTPPIRVIIPGRVFRNEDLDSTHEIAFYQVEGVMVDKKIHMGHLKYTIRTMLSHLFGKEVSIRMRPGYFPYVEPGVEIDFSCPFCENSSKYCRVCKKSRWIEFMGAGLIHPEVLREGGINPQTYSGFAFGFGLSRLAMIRYGIQDIRGFMNPDVRFLSQF